MRIAKINRARVQRPHGFSYWCMGCDMALVWPGMRCPKCGKVALPEKAGKPNPTTARAHDMLFEDLDDA